MNLLSSCCLLLLLGFLGSVSPTKLHKEHAIQKNLKMKSFDSVLKRVDNEGPEIDQKDFPYYYSFSFPIGFKIPMGEKYRAKLKLEFESMVKEVIVDFDYNGRSIDYDHSGPVESLVVNLHDERTGMSMNGWKTEAFHATPVTGRIYASDNVNVQSAKFVVDAWWVDGGEKVPSCQRGEHSNLGQVTPAPFRFGLIIAGILMFVCGFCLCCWYLNRQNSQEFYNLTQIEEELTYMDDYTPNLVVTQPTKETEMTTFHFSQFPK